MRNLVILVTAAGLEQQVNNKPEHKISREAGAYEPKAGVAAVCGNERGVVKPVAECQEEAWKHHHKGHGIAVPAYPDAVFQGSTATRPHKAVGNERKYY